MLPILFSLTLCLSAALLFWFQLFTARILLPVLGGSASVWNTCLVFFQINLLLGYLYAHATEKWLPLRFRGLLHPLLLLAAGIVLPVSLRGIALPTGETDPVLWQLETLLVIVGAPFLILSGTAPLLQAWFARSREKSAHDPYFLYAASNLGSLGALLSYPVLVEPHLHLSRQSICWAAGYFLLIGLTLLCGFAVYNRGRGKDAAPEPASAVQEPDAAPITLAQRLRWIVYAFVPSSLLLGVTTHITADVASVPFLWIIPLALYLLTFIIAFQTTFRVSEKIVAFVQAILLTWVGVLLALHNPHESVITLVVHLTAFFVTALLCHCRLARLRPPARHLTEFYLLISLGGALGGIFNALIAPVLFNDVVEYPLVLVAACLLRPGAWPGRGKLRAALGDVIYPAIIFGLLFYGQYFASPNFRFLDSYSPWIRTVAVALLQGVDYVEPAIVVGFAFLALFLFQWRPIRFALGMAAAIIAGMLTMTDQSTIILTKARDFYGIYKVLQTGPPYVHILYNGTTSHGYQSLTPGFELTPLSYFFRKGPLGHLFKDIEGDGLTRRVGVIGLGAGTIACYGKAGEDWTYFELSPTDIAIANDPKYFTLLRDCPVHPKTIAGDGRLSLAREPDHSFGMIIIDAFTSDAIPVHLITREAMELYLTKIRHSGLIVFHITNTHFDLGPALGNVASSLNLAGVRWIYDANSDDIITGNFPSDWVVIARSKDDLKRIASEGGWFPLTPTPGEDVWTDDYSNLFGALR